jgi:hypothetical protein
MKIYFLLFTLTLSLNVYASETNHDMHKATNIKQNHNSHKKMDHSMHAGHKMKSIKKDTLVTNKEKKYLQYFLQVAKQGSWDLTMRW